MSLSRVEVALPLPLRRTFTYLVPEHLRGEVAVGSALVVPFGRRTLTGFAVGEGTAEPGVESGKLKAVRDVLDPGPLFPGDLLETTRWISEYYLCGWGEVLRAGVPEGLQVRSRLVVRAGEAEASARVGAEGGAAERRLLEALVGRSSIDAVALGRLVRVPSVHHTLRRLEAKGAVRLTEEIRRSGYGPDEPAGIPLDDLEVEVESHRGPLTADQERVLAPLREALAGRRFLTALLHGVTGSGKTAVYLALAAETLAGGRSALVLVPEIAITPQMVALFREQFGEQVALLHSRRRPRERHQEWRRVLAGEARMVIGPRSAVLAPLTDLGLVIVDEEHEPSYKQSEPAPRYHARDVAVFRASRTGALCVLGSATPSAESYRNAREGRYLLLELPERVTRRPLPTIRVVDLGQERLPPRETDPARPVQPIEPGAGLILSAVLQEAIEQRLARGEQSILFLNRRGFSPALVCAGCGQAEECANCSVTMTYHRTRGQLQCHYCGAVRPPPERCPACGGAVMRYQGVGTQRVEAALQQRFPSARVIRMDSDSTRSRDAHVRMYRDFAAGRGDILLGTQMVAKGFHFPGVTLVGVVSADAELHFPDFRADERTFQLLTQVAGRAGRGEQPGEVVIQTWATDNPGIVQAAAGDYQAFMLPELELRKSLQYPPYHRLLRVMVKSRSEADAAAGAARVARRLTRVAPSSVRVMGPAPAPLHRVNRWYRHHVLLFGRAATTLHRCVEAAGLEEGGRAGTVTTLDMDPSDVL
jgi:primosomal protein N' (replication factor Y)